MVFMFLYHEDAVSLNIFKNRISPNDSGKIIEHKTGCCVTVIFFIFSPIEQTDVLPAANSFQNTFPMAHATYKVLN